MSEDQANRKYNTLYKEMIKLFGHDGMTMTTELTKIGKKLFKSKYLGTFPQDKLPEKIYTKPTFYAIINVDTQGMPGSHWTAIAGFRNSDKILVFDSFGRAAKTLLPTLKHGSGQVVNTDLDAEQKIIQESCGQFSMAWLLFVEKYGLKNAKLI